MFIWNFTLILLQLYFIKTPIKGLKLLIGEIEENNFKCVEGEGAHPMPQLTWFWIGKLSLRKLLRKPIRTQKLRETEFEIDYVVGEKYLY